MSLRIAAILAAAVVLVGVLENVLFGSDTVGTTRHVVSVGFFFAAVAGIVALMAVAIAAIVRTARGRAGTAR